MSEMKEMKQIAKGGAILFAGDAFRIVFSYLFLLLATHLLSAEKLGAYYWASALVMLLAQVALMGMGQSINYFVPRYEVNKGKAAAARVFAYIIGSVALRALVIGVLLFIFAPYVCGVLHKEKFVLLVRLFSLGLPLLAGWPIVFRYLLAKYDAKAAVLIGDIARGIVRLLTLLLIVFCGWRYFALVGSDLVTSLLILLAGLLYIFYRYGMKSDYALNGGERRAMVAYSLPFFVLGILNIEKPFMMLLGYYLNVRTIAVFSIALKVALIGNLFFAAIIAMFSPVTTALIAANNWEGLRSNYQAITRWIFITSLPIFCLSVMYPASILRIFGVKFMVGAEALVILSVGYLFNYATSATSTIINMSGKVWLNMGNLFGQLLVTMLLGFFLIPHYRLNGAAVAFSAGIIFINIIRLFQAGRIAGTSPYSWYLFKPLAAALVTAALAAVLFPIGHIFHFLPLVALVLGYLAVYILLVMLFGFNREDTALLREAYEKIRAKAWNI